MSEPIKIDIWSDIACPFCYIGKRKFEEGVRASGVDVEIEFHSFELSPDTPVDYEGSHAEKIAEKMNMTIADAKQMEQRVVATAQASGLTFDYETMRPTRTLKAHQVLHLAKQHELQGEMKERLMAAYFTEGRNVGRDDELADLAAEVGLDREEVLRALDSGAFADAVAADIQQARAFGIRGVPFFIIDGRYAVSGAQDPSVFAQALQQARSEKAVAS